MHLATLMLTGAKDDHGIQQKLTAFGGLQDTGTGRILSHAVYHLQYIHLLKDATGNMSISNLARAGFHNPPLPDCRDIQRTCLH
jgi:hypothetical protein